MINLVIMLEGRNEHILNDGIIDDEENTMISTGVYPPIIHCYRRKEFSI